MSDSSREPLIRPFLSWFEGGGGTTACKILPVVDMGLGAIAKRSLKYGDLVANIPWSMVLCADTARRHPTIGIAIRTAQDEIEAHLGPGWLQTSRGLDWERGIVCLLLLHERSLGTSSQWRPYIDLLPKIPTGATCWLHDDPRLEAKALADDGFVEAWAKSRERVHCFYRAVIQPLCTRHPALFPKEECSETAIAWAHGTFLSRALVLPRPASLQANEDGRCHCEGLVPLLDMVNHGSGHQLQFETPTTQGVDQNSILLEVRVKKDISDGEQVLLDYGLSSSRSEMLLHHGFQ